MKKHYGVRLGSLARCIALLVTLSLVVSMGGLAVAYGGVADGQSAVVIVDPDPPADEPQTGVVIADPEPAPDEPLPTVVIADPEPDADEPLPGVVIADPEQDDTGGDTYTLIEYPYEGKWWGAPIEVYEGATLKDAPLPPLYLDYNTPSEAVSVEWDDPLDTPVGDPGTINKFSYTISFGDEYPQVVGGVYYAPKTYEVEITVKPYPDYSHEIDASNGGEKWIAKEGYEEAPPFEVDITNTGNQPMTRLQLRLSGKDADLFTITKPDGSALDEQDSWSKSLFGEGYGVLMDSLDGTTSPLLPYFNVAPFDVTPKTGLAAGAYNVEVEVAWVSYTAILNNYGAVGMGYDTHQDSVALTFVVEPLIGPIDKIDFPDDGYWWGAAIEVYEGSTLKDAPLPPLYMELDDSEEDSPADHIEWDDPLDTSVGAAGTTGQFTYTVYFKESSVYNPKQYTVDVKVLAKPVRDYFFEPEKSYTFKPQNVGYGNLVGSVFSVYNNGTAEMDYVSVRLTGEDASAFKATYLNGRAMYTNVNFRIKELGDGYGQLTDYLQGRQYCSYMITPKANLAAGDYEATAEVSWIYLRTPLQNYGIDGFGYDVVTEECKISFSVGKTEFPYDFPYWGSDVRAYEGSKLSEVELPPPYIPGDIDRIEWDQDGDTVIGKAGTEETFSYTIYPEDSARYSPKTYKALVISVEYPEWDLRIDQTEALDFGEVEGVVPSKVVTLTNEGNMYYFYLNGSISGADPDAFEVTAADGSALPDATSGTHLENGKQLTSGSLDGPGGTLSFGVSPKAGLEPGTYKATIEVDAWTGTFELGNYGEMAHAYYKEEKKTFDVSVTVKEPSEVVKPAPAPNPFQNLVNTLKNLLKNLAALLRR